MPLRPDETTGASTAFFQGTFGHQRSTLLNQAAERAAWAAPGVRAVENRIALLATAVDPEAEWSGMPEA